MKRIYTNAILLPMTDGSEPIQNGAIGIEGDRIHYIGPTPDNTDEYDKVICCKGKVILPGFVNTHNHVAMSLLRGFADDLPLQEWLEKHIWPMEARFTGEHVKAGALLTMLEMIESGTTCFLDMYDFMGHVGEGVLESGLRATLCRGIIGFGEEDVVKAKLEDAYRFSKEWHGQGEGRISTMLSPHAPYTCAPEVIVAMVEKAKEFSLPIHTHMSETAFEVQLNVDRYGDRPVQHLQKLGFFDVPSLLAHVVHVTEAEIEILAKYDVKIAHNPGSNLKLGSGVSPVGMMMEKGMRPSLATDGSSSNNNADMLEEIQLAALIHKGVNMDPKLIPARTALQMGTIYGAEALFLDKEIGTLEIGKKADFITMDLTATHMQPLHHVESNIVYSACRSDVIDVVVNGQELMRNRECLTLDKEKVIYEANQLITALL